MQRITNRHFIPLGVSKAQDPHYWVAAYFPKQDRIGEVFVYYGKAVPSIYDPTDDYDYGKNLIPMEPLPVVE
jgi:hypothetical protein